MKASQSIARRSVTSVAWNVVASLIGVVVGFVRSVLLARLLPIETFGVYAFAGSIVGLSVVLPNFGMGGAFLHRAPETEDEEQAAAIHFTLKLVFTLIWTSLLMLCAFVFTGGQTRTALLLLTAVQGGSQLTQTPNLILTRRVVHRRLALLRFLKTLFTTVVVLGLAWQGVTLWALLATDIVNLTLNVVLLYVWRPVWRPRLAWSSSRVRYFLRFGSRNLVAFALLRALDRLDDLWTGLFLGNVSLSFYSRAYRFATYPRIILAAPINMVAGGTYAELKGRRLRLSQAFFRTNAFLVRTGFLLAGLLARVAPEFIRLMLGVKWLPMLDAFRLMLVFTLFDPIKLTVADLFTALGRPEQVVRARFVQLMVLIVGLFLLGPPLGIVGVALAVNAMLIIGIGLLLWQARAHIDFSITRLFGAPFVGLSLGLLLAFLSAALPAIRGSDWRTAAIKASVFVLVYGGVLLALERATLLMIWDLLNRMRKSFVEREVEHRTARHVLEGESSAGKR